MSVKNLNAKSPYALKSQKSGSVRARDAFVSHCKRVAGTEDRALWVVDTLEEGGLNVFFDRNDLDEISMDKLKEHVLSSAVIVTVLDPATYDSEWVRKEHEWAEAAGIPIVPFYDADLYKWKDLSHWVSKYPAWFRTPAVEYHRAFHRNAKAKLVERVTGEKAGGEAAADADTPSAAAEASRGGGAERKISVVESVAASWRALASRIAEIPELPNECGKLQRQSGYISDELNMLPPTADLGADFVSELRAAAEATHELVDECAAAAAEAAKNAKGGGGGGMCGGGKAAATVAPAPDAGLTEKLLAKDVEIAELRARLRARAAAAPPRRSTPIHGGANAAAPALEKSKSSAADFWRAQVANGGGGDASWEETEQALTAALASGGGDDAAAAAEAVSLLPRLKPLLCGVDGRVKAAKLGEIFGTDAGGLVEVVLKAAANAREVERVFNIECRQKGGDGTYPLMADVDAGFVLARENATLAELRTVVTAAGAELADDDPSCAFLGAGEWSWALHDGKSKVRPSQEGTLRAFEHVPGLCVLGGAGGRASATPSAASSRSTSPVPPEVKATELFVAAKAAAALQKEEEAASALTIDAVLDDVDLRGRFTRLCMGGTLRPETIEFVAAVRAATAEVGRVDGAAAKWAAAERACRSLAATFLVPGSAALDDATRASALDQFRAAFIPGGDADALLASLAAAETAALAACAAKLDDVRKDLTKTSKRERAKGGAAVDGGGARKPTVIIVGGGVAGATTARWFDKEHAGDGPPLPPPSSPPPPRHPPPPPPPPPHPPTSLLQTSSISTSSTRRSTMNTHRTYASRTQRGRRMDAPSSAPR